MFQRLISEARLITWRINVLLKSIPSPLLDCSVCLARAGPFSSAVSDQLWWDMEPGGLRKTPAQKWLSLIVFAYVTQRRELERDWALKNDACGPRFFCSALFVSVSPTLTHESIIPWYLSVTIMTWLHISASRPTSFLKTHIFLSIKKHFLNSSGVSVLVGCLQSE